MTSSSTMSRYIKNVARVASSLGPSEERGYAMWVGYDIIGVDDDLSHPRIVEVRRSGRSRRDQLHAGRAGRHRDVQQAGPHVGQPLRLSPRGDDALPQPERLSYVR